MGNIAIVQAGGPTSVLNASLAGFLDECFAVGDYQKIIGFRQGIEGLVKGRTINLETLSKSDIEALKYQSGAILGSGRYPLTSTDFATVKETLERERIDQLVFVGGNGTMWSADEIAKIAPHIQVIGIPKTVDNDLLGTDHAPGYLSAAKFVAEGVRSLALDLWAMRNFEKVRIVEVMGRNVGWLAAAASLAQQSLPGFPKIQIHLPEQDFDVKEFVANISEALLTESCLLVVVSEGIRDRQGQPLGEFRIGGDQGSKILGRAAQGLAEELRRSGIPCRSENLGILQRANTWSVVQRDREEAYLLGQEAIRSLKSGLSGVMLGLNRPNPLSENALVKVTPLGDVAGRERKLDKNYYTKSGVTDSFKTWLSETLGEPLADEDSFRKVWLIVSKV